MKEYSSVNGTEPSHDSSRVPSNEQVLSVLSVARFPFLPVEEPSFPSPMSEKKPPPCHIRAARCISGEFMDAE